MKNYNYIIYFNVFYHSVVQAANLPTTLADAIDAHYIAGNAMLRGDLSGFAALWSESDDITHMGPMGDIVKGREAVMKQFEKESGMGFKGTLTSDDHHIVQLTPDVGYVVCIERTRGITKDGEAITVDIRATTVFRKEQGFWRAILHSTDRI